MRTKKPGRVDAKPGFRSAVSALMVAVSSTLGAYTGSTRYAPQRHHLHQTCLRWQFLGFLWLIPNPIVTIEGLPGGFKVVDAHGQSLAYFYARENDNDAGTGGVLTMDEARRLASNVAKLPELLGAVTTNGEGSG